MEFRVWVSGSVDDLMRFDDKYSTNDFWNLNSVSPRQLWKVLIYLQFVEFFIKFILPSQARLYYRCILISVLLGIHSRMILIRDSAYYEDRYRDSVNPKGRFTNYILVVRFNPNYLKLRIKLHYLKY
jgi:hypothetical protein